MNTQNIWAGGWKRVVNVVCGVNRMGRDLAYITMTHVKWMSFVQRESIHCISDVKRQIDPHAEAIDSEQTC